MDVIGFMYIFEAGNFNIKTPGVSDFSQIKKSIKQYPDKIVNRSEYPTGLVIEIEQKSNQIVVYSNRRLIENPDGFYTAPEQ